MSTATAAPIDRGGLLRRGLRLEYLTVGWNLVEGVIAVAAALASGSVALLGFGIDSFVESISGSILIWRLRAEDRGDRDSTAIERIERRAERLVGISFLALAAYVTIDASLALLAGERPEGSPVGIGLTAVSLAVMLWLARAKTAHRPRARQPRACRRCGADVRLLVPVGHDARRARADALFGLWWADPVAAYGIAF